MSERILYLLVILFAFFISRIAVAQICLALIIVLWLVHFFHSGRSFRSIRLVPLAIPLILLMVQYLFSVAGSLDPWYSLSKASGIGNLLLVILFVELMRGEADVQPILDTLIIMGTCLGLCGILQFLGTEHGGIRLRITGPMSHYMTYSGILMVVEALIVARIAMPPPASPGRRPLSLWHRWGWPYFSLVVVTVALVLTYSRHAWVGCIAAVALIAAIIRSWKLIAVPLALVLLLSLTPGSLANRIHHVFDTRRDTSNVDRLNLLKSGLDMVTDHPLTGVGVGMVESVYPAYRTRTAVKEQNSHLHNTPLQICAESGMPGLIFFVWLVFRFYRDIIGNLRRDGLLRRPPPAGRTATSRFYCQLGPLAAGTAFFVAGLFEYNFGDTEALMLFMFIASCAYAARLDPIVRKEREKPAMAEGRKGEKTVPT